MYLVLIVRAPSRTRMLTELIPFSNGPRTPLPLFFSHRWQCNAIQQCRDHFVPATCTYAKDMGKEVFSKDAVLKKKMKQVMILTSALLEVWLSSLLAHRTL
jgi:hypothetical protein